MVKNNQAHTQNIQTILEKGVEQIYPHKRFLKEKLLSGEKLTLYLGIDPTGSDLHLGHAIPLFKLRQFQKLGHRIILLIGDFTAMCGDPDKSHTRQRLSRDEIKKNIQGYKQQISKILELKGDNAVQFKYNYNWLAKLKFEDIIEVASYFTVQRMLERDLFEKRIKKGNPVRLHEFMYPLMQAYDSVVLNVDGEIGGNDQTFNMLAGRDLMRQMKKQEKFVLTTKLLADPSGKKMGKTEGNTIILKDSPKEIFGKIMSWNDEIIPLGFELCTPYSLTQVNYIKKQLKSNQTNPRDLKVQLAKEVVTFYYNKQQADHAENEFNKIFRQKGLPNNIKIFNILNIKYNIIDLMVGSGLTSSKSEAKRLVQQGGVKLASKKITNWQNTVKLLDGDILQVGKRKFIKFKIKK